ncbi:MAG: AAA family ATPase [Alphaproteobacteria bacterium]|nr:AAA family ATPase [Alphaproteobacteria bacterium]
MTRKPITALELARFLICVPFFIMLGLMMIEASLSATTTYLVIQTGKDVARGNFIVADLLWILAAQSASYIVGAISWIYAERAGFLAYGRYMLRFARDNRYETRALGEKDVRERVEPFLTGETFHVYFHLIYEIEGDLRIVLAFVLNVIVIGTQIDGSLPVAYALVFVVLFTLQWTMRKRISTAYLENQRTTNRMTAQGYTAWDNVFSGNRYNLRLWLDGFKSKLRDGLHAQIVAIMTKEGLSAASAIIGLSIVFGTMALVAAKNVGNLEVLVALAATLPRQIDMTHDVHEFTSGWNDLLAQWARLTGVASNMHPEFDPEFESRIKVERLTLREGDKSNAVQSVDEALALILAHPSGRVNVRGPNGSGKSTLLTKLKSEVRTRAYYWPTADRLSFRFAQGMEPEDELDEDGNPLPESAPGKKPGFSSGERQLRALQEIVHSTHAPIYLLDEWDANLDPKNRVAAEALVDELARRARVVEISHRDRV